MKIILKSEPNSRSSYPVNTVYDITTEEVAIMIDADFELQKQELDDLSEAKKRPIEAIIKDLNKPEINNPKRFRDNTVSGLVKNSSGTYEDREYEASDGLNYHKRPPKDKKKDKKSINLVDAYVMTMYQVDLNHQAFILKMIMRRRWNKSSYFIKPFNLYHYRNKTLLNKSILRVGHRLTLLGQKVFHLLPSKSD